MSNGSIIVFSSDNGPGMINIGRLLGESSGPFRGGFFTPPWEGSMRVPDMVRCPGKVPAGVVTGEMLSVHDWYKTPAALAGAVGQGAH
jgi:arylsulfatase A-like enzyme